MYPGGVEEYVSVVGTDAFMEFVESIQAEGVLLERKPMGEGTKPATPLVIEVDEEKDEKDLENLEIEIPILSPRVYREYKNLASLDVRNLPHQRLAYLQFSEADQREIVFKDVTTGEITHTTILDTAGVADFRSVIGYFAQTIMKDLRLVSGYDALYPKVKQFVQDELFDKPVDLESPNTLRNLSEPAATRTVLDTLKTAINALTIQSRGDALIRDTIKLRETRPFVAKEQGYLVPKKSVFNRIIGDSPLELEFATFLENCPDIISYVKNYLAVQFKIDYINAKGEISNYFPDFIVKESPGKLFVVETKGLEDLDVPLKMRRLKQWCADVNAGQNRVQYDFVYVDEESFNRYKPKTFEALRTSFREYRD
jgi:type III restriction enzyme